MRKFEGRRGPRDLEEFRLEVMRCAKTAATEKHSIGGREKRNKLRPITLPTITAHKIDQH